MDAAIKFCWPKVDISADLFINGIVGSVPIWGNACAGIRGMGKDAGGIAICGGIGVKWFGLNPDIGDCIPP